MSDDLRAALDALEPHVHQQLADGGFDRDWFEAEASRLNERGRRDNHVTGLLSPPEPADIVDVPTRGDEGWSEYTAAGEAALAGGEMAFVVLAGGMATRMGGVVKALVEALPGHTFLDLRLRGHRLLEERVGRRIPFWLMTSDATDAPIREALGADLDGYNIATFPQRLSLRLNTDGSLYNDESGRLSPHAPGHGDLPDALRDSGLLGRFVEAGGRHVTMANLDNLGATLDPAVIGMHLQVGTPVSCEVVDKLGSDTGGIPVRLDGRPVLLEEFRIPPEFDPSQVRVFNTNTFHFSASALLSLDMEWKYFVVPKEVDGVKVIQFERLVNEVTSHLDATYIRVPREGAKCRFLPVKDQADLAAKQPLIELVARDRGMI